MTKHELIQLLEAHNLESLHSEFGNLIDRAKWHLNNIETYKNNEYAEILTAINLLQNALCTIGSISGTSIVIDEIKGKLNE
jgi:hypothetical protein